MWRKSSYSNPNGECIEVDDDHWGKSSYSFSNGNCLEWKKSTASAFNGDCVEWRKSTASAGHGACVETAHDHRVILVRDSKLADDSPILGFSPAAWQAFTENIKQA